MSDPGDQKATSLFRILCEAANTKPSTIQSVLKERERQEKKWGTQNHHQYKWIAIITEELGEAAKASLEIDLELYCKELIEVAACAIAAVESARRDS